MRILITGSSGFFGKALVRALQRTVSEFTCFCHYNKNHILYEDKRFRPVQSNLLDLTSHRELLENTKPTHIVHLAWSVHPGQFWDDPNNSLWKKATINLYKEFNASKGDIFIGAGTIAEYCWETEILDETKTKLKPHSFYGQCKLETYRELINIYNRSVHKTAVYWGRIGYFFGENEPKEKLIPKIIDSLANGSSITTVASNLSRPYAHVRYLAEAILALLSAPSKENFALNISGDRQIKLSEIVSILEKALNKRAHSIEYRKVENQPLRLVIPTSILREYFNYSVPDTVYEDLAKLTLKDQNNA